MKQGLFWDSPTTQFLPKTKVKPDSASTRNTLQIKQERRGTKKVDGQREMSGFDMSVDVLGGAQVYDYQSNNRLPKPVHGSIYLNYCCAEIVGLRARWFLTSPHKRKITGYKRWIFKWYLVRSCIFQFRGRILLQAHFSHGSVFPWLNK